VAACRSRAPFQPGALRTCVPCLLVNPAMLGAPLQFGALSVRVVRLWVNPALVMREVAYVIIMYVRSNVLTRFTGVPHLSKLRYSKINASTSTNRSPLVMCVFVVICFAK